MSSCIPDIICVSQITFKFTGHALIVDNRALLLFRGQDLTNLLGLKDRFNLETNVGAQILYLPFDGIS